MQAAVAAAIAPAAPEVTMPDSAPVNSAKRRPTARCKSSMLTKYCAASSLGLANFWELQRAAQVSPGAATVDDGLHTQAGVYILPFAPPMALAVLA